MWLVAILYLGIFSAAGVAVARLAVGGAMTLRLFSLGLALGLALLMWLPALLSFLLGFTIAAQYIALALAAVLLIAAVILLRRRRGLYAHERFNYRALVVCAPLIIIIWVLMLNHVITPASDGSLHSGQSTYGDMCMHLGFITSISVQQTFPPEYSIMAGIDVGYPFLCDSVSSTFYTLGCSLRFSALLPMLYAALVVVLNVYFLFETWLGERAAAIAAYIFFIGGGFGFAYYFDMAQTTGSDSLYGLMHDFYNTPTNQTELGLRWVNAIADMLVPQRATLFGWALLFACLQLLFRASLRGETRLFYPLGVLAGALPLVHTHSFLALGLISAFLLCAQWVEAILRRDGNWKRRLLPFLAYGVIAVALAAPQLIAFTFRQAFEGGFLRLHWNWANETDSWLWFYIKNLGLVFILLMPAFLAAKRESKLFYGGALLIWAASEVIVFQPNVYDNNKLLFVWYALSCGIVAEYLSGVWTRLQSHAMPLRRISNGSLAVICSLALFTSGALTLAREYVSGDHLTLHGVVESGYQVVSADQVELAEYVSENTSPDAVFITATNHNNAIAMLTGRNIVCGSPSFLYYHGLDYSDRVADLELAYSLPEHHLGRVASAYGADYILISSYERGSYSVDTEWFDANLECVFENAECKLYAI